MNLHRNHKNKASAMDYPMEEPGSMAPQINDCCDDECSTDSGCSSGSSTGSAERLSRRIVGGDVLRSPRSHSSLGRRFKNQVSWARGPGERCTKSCSLDSTRPRSCGESPLHSQSPDAHSSDSEGSAHQFHTLETLFKVFQGLRLSKPEIAEKKHSKKSPKRILRAPVSYMYVRGLSGLPTQRVPRNSQPYSCHELRSIY